MPFIIRMSDHAPQRDGVLVKWSVNRTDSIGVLFDGSRNNPALSPPRGKWQLFGRIACEIAAYDTSTVPQSTPILPTSQTTLCMPPTTRYWLPPGLLRR